MFIIIYLKRIVTIQSLVYVFSPKDNVTVSGRFPFNICSNGTTYVAL